MKLHRFSIFRRIDMRILSDDIRRHFGDAYVEDSTYVNVNNAPKQVRMNNMENQYITTIYARNLAIFESNDRKYQMYATTLAENENKPSNEDIVILLACHNNEVASQQLPDCTFEKAIKINSLEEYYPSVGKLISGKGLMN